MKKFTLFLALLLAFFLPNFLVSQYQEKEIPLQEVPTVTEPMKETNMTIRVKSSDTITAMELEEYLLGVLLGEMPADFEPEALKAQSVATRTYTLRMALKQNKHEDADVCTDASCCQAFVGEAQYLQSGGSDENLLKMKYVIKETMGEVLTYQGNLIEATYFSCSGGRTEDAVAVWGTAVPYLRSVDSPGEENARHYEEEFTFSTESFCRKLGLLSVSEITENDLSLSYTVGNGVEKLKIGNEEFTGTQVRALLELPSTSFTVSVLNDEIIITTKGYGHRVGMSQYGADAMAVAGCTYEQILAHYYPGTHLEKYIPT